MSEAYTFTKTYGNNILYRGYRDGKTIISKIPYKPTLYVKSDGVEATWKDIFGKPLKPIKFNSIRDARDYVKQYSDVQNFEIHGNTSYHYQMIKEMFPNKIDFDFKQTKILTIDLESSVNSGFPDVMNPLEEVTLITVVDRHSSEITTFGLQDVKVSTKYINCGTEVELLKKFVLMMEEQKPDILTGWYSDSFDFPYLAARIEKILGEEWVKKISPFGAYRWDDFEKDDGKIDRKIEFVGIAILDYLALYKKFSGEKHEEYGLGYVANFQIGSTKLENPYDSFQEFSKDLQLFTEYNIKDAVLVNEMDKKMRLFELCLTMIYRAKCNFSDVLGTTKVWECKIHDYLYNKQIAIPNYARKESRSLMGAYVKPPLAGRYEWEVSVDAEALYPCIMMSWNISPETLQPRMIDFDVDSALSRKLDTNFLQENNSCMTANGAVFTKNVRGFIPSVVQEEFDLRKSTKNEMLDLQRQIEIKTSKNEECFALVSLMEEKNITQKAIKTGIASLYGATGEKFFKYFDIRLAEAITSTGQTVTKTCEIAANEVMNKLLGTVGKDYVIMSHTDSLFIALGDIVKKHFSHIKDDNLICDKIDQIVKDKITPAINKACAGITEYTNAYENRLNLKREKIGRYGIHLPAKNRYAIMVMDNEGVRYATPKLSVTGLEIVRSSTPGNMKKTLKKALEMVLISDERTVQTYIADEYKKFLLSDVKDIAFPKSCNGITKWSSNVDNEMFKKGCPIQVRAAVLHNSELKRLKLNTSYPNINDGDKIKFVYLKEPNTLRQNVIGFKGKLPPEFNLHRYVDYDLQWSKTFIEPLKSIMDVVGWKTEKHFTLDSMFD